MRPRLADSDTISASNEQRGLSEIADLGDVLARSVGIKDIFRAVSSRLCDTVNCCRTKLWLLDEKRSKLRMHAVWRLSDDEIQDDKAEADNRPPERCFTAKRILNGDDEYGSSVAIPLCRGSEVIGVLQLFFTDASLLTEPSQFEMVSELVSPAIVNSVIFERNRKRALTDEITELPNQRSFYLALEQHIADAQANPDERPLSILAIDLESRLNPNAWADHSRDVGLLSSARLIHQNLRAMDFFARASDKEFLVILPGATEPISQHIIARIEEAFTAQRSDIEEKTIYPRVGWAVFGTDGDTAESLLARARLRKVISKEDPRRRKVLLFPHRT